MLIIMLEGLAWDHLWFEVPFLHLGGSTGRNRTWYQSTRFKSPKMYEISALSRVLFMGVKCTTSNEREAMKCFRKKLNFLGILIVHEK